MVTIFLRVDIILSERKSKVRLFLMFNFISNLEADTMMERHSKILTLRMAAWSRFKQVQFMIRQNRLQTWTTDIHFSYIKIYFFFIFIVCLTVCFMFFFCFYSFLFHQTCVYWFSLFSLPFLVFFLNLSFFFKFPLFFFSIFLSLQSNYILRFLSFRDCIFLENFYKFTVV